MHSRVLVRLKLEKMAFIIFLNVQSVDYSAIRSHQLIISVRNIFLIVYFHYYIKI